MFGFGYGICETSLLCVFEIRVASCGWRVWVPAFLTKKQIYDWIKAGEKTIELRSGKSLNGENITFLNGRRQTVKGRILRKREGKFEDLLNAATYLKIVPVAKSLDEAVAFVKEIYPLTEGTFTAYEFQLNKE